LVEQVKHLIEYQHLEDKKSDLLQKRKELPRRIAELENDYKKAEEAYLVKKAEKEEATQQHRTLDKETTEFRDKIARLKNKTREVKTNKEYHALLKEIESAEKEIKTREDRMLELEETIEVLSSEVGELEKTAEERKNRFEQEKGSLSAENEEVESKLAHLESLQDQVRPKIDKRYIKHLDGLIRARNRIAVSPVLDGVCQACHLNIPPQHFIELQRDEAVLRCPNCSRFIYWPGHETYAGVKDEVEERAASF
jgi:hypothetical protein